MTAQIRQVEAFLMLAQTGSFSEASRRFGLSQPAFSLSIQRLEEVLGVRLFHRTSRRVKLTAEGEAFLPMASGLLRNWTGVFEEMADLTAVRRGRVALAALPSIAAGLLPPVVLEFTRKHPGVKLEIHDVLQGEVIELVRSGRVDFGISVGPDDSAETEFLPLLDDNFVALLRHDHPLAGHDRISWEALSRHPLVSMTSTTSVRRLTDFTFAEARIGARFLSEVNHLATIAGLVAAGYALAALPALCLPVVLRPDLEWRPLGSPVARRTLGLLRLRHSPSVAAEAFLQELLGIGARNPFPNFAAEISFRPAAQ